MSSDFARFGFLRCALVAPVVALGDPLENARRVTSAASEMIEAGASVVLFPELCLSGYSCEDLFYSAALLRDVRAALAAAARSTGDHPATIVVGAPWALADGRLLNCAFVLARGRVVGGVPKLHLPNHGEFYDGRWFASGLGVDAAVTDAELGDFEINSDQLFQLQAGKGGAADPVSFALELCEDLWAPQPPGARHALAGAELVLNPSASNELVGKADYRRDLVRMSSATRLCGYLYASAGPSESTKDVVYGGHLIAAECGAVVGEGERFALGGTHLLVDLDCHRLRHDRRQSATFRNAPRPTPYRIRAAGQVVEMPLLERAVDPHPFVPADESVVDARAAEILAIQATGLARRLDAARSERMVIGLSGGLDSTLAFLVCIEVLARTGRPAAALHAVTMPGPGTGARTLAAARAVAAEAGIDLREISIDPAVQQHLADLAHPADLYDVTFENAQARERTQLLFDLANKVGGIVVGTGDLSELALGWCTYNADHMSNYGVNAGVPKTLIAYLVRWYARHRAPSGLAAALDEVLAIPISPELVPGTEEDGVAQHTEALVGPYELHDFFLFHYLREGAAPDRILALAERAFEGRYEASTLREWLEVFLRRFHAQQFKRTTLPPGPKVGTVSLSPRGDWRMPDESVPPTLGEG
ncbi:MAG: NAD(+) synthase [Pseudomonadota bacterium]|nr:NAD(+) synthase [Pseudomonadota bacterium]